MSGSAGRSLGVVPTSPLSRPLGQSAKCAIFDGHLLAKVADVPRTEFAPDGPSIGIPIGQDPPDFTLKLGDYTSDLTER